MLLLSTCGTSLLTNGASAEDRTWLTQRSNARELAADEQARLDGLVQQRCDQLLSASLEKQRRMSAEINGIDAAVAKYRPTRTTHVLVHTDTAIGLAAAGIVRAARHARGATVSERTAPGLRTDHLAGFREALAELTAGLDPELAEYRRQGQFIVFNLTGGFKSINAYLQALGMLHAERCVFLFEGAPELMEIPRLPIRLAEGEEVRKGLDVFRRLAVGIPVPEAQGAHLPASLLMADDGHVALSVWGDVVWARERTALMGERLLPSLSSRVRHAPALEGQVSRESAAHRAEVNDALDALCAHLEQGRPMLKSRTFKALAGNPVPGSTHELYAWSTGGAGRLFGRFEGDVFVVNELRKHL
jgi:putative CRISPR-associated protein (TIGR02619 family)